MRTLGNVDEGLIPMSRSLLPGAATPQIQRLGGWVGPSVRLRSMLFPSCLRDNATICSSPWKQAEPSESVVNEA